MGILDQSHLELIQFARGIIRLRFKQDFHHKGAALRTYSGKIYSAVHLKATVNRISVCAEAIAIGMAAADGDTEIESIVAVDENGNVISPCGMCRELISDYSPNAMVIVPNPDSDERDPIVVPVTTLLPNKYCKIKSNQHTEETHQTGSETT